MIYRDAFTDGVSASLRYRLTKAGIEQDIVLERQLPVAPEDFNLDPAYTTLDVTSEFIEARPARY